MKLNSRETRKIVTGPSLQDLSTFSCTFFCSLVKSYISAGSSLKFLLLALFGEREAGFIFIDWKNRSRFLGERSIPSVTALFFPACELLLSVFAILLSRFDHLLSANGLLLSKIYHLLSAPSRQWFLLAKDPHSGWLFLKISASRAFWSTRSRFYFN